MTKLYLAIIAAILSVAGVCIAFPELPVDVINTLVNTFNWVGAHFGQIMLVVCILGMVWSYFRRDTLKIILFALSMIVSQVFGW